MIFFKSHLKQLRLRLLLILWQKMQNLKWSFGPDYRKPTVPSDKNLVFRDFLFGVFLMSKNHDLMLRIKLLKNWSYLVDL